jgi:hypothetical protein
MIVTIKQLQAVHYYYFLMGIFSLINAIFFGFASLLSYMFIVFYVLNSIISWYVAWVARKKMSDYVVVQSAIYFIKHTILTLGLVAFTILIWVYDIIPNVLLLHLIIGANYFVIFLAAMWYGMSRFGFIKSFFTIYDSYVFRKSKGFILKLRSSNLGFFGREIISERDIDDYKYGSVDEVDDNMVSAWRNQDKKQYCMECLARIELALARQGLNYIRDKIAFLRSLPKNKQDAALLEDVEDDLIEKKVDIMEFEKSFYVKSGESKFL